MTRFTLRADIQFERGGLKGVGDVRVVDAVLWGQILWRNVLEK